MLEDCRAAGALLARARRQARDARRGFLFLAHHWIQGRARLRGIRAATVLNPSVQELGRAVRRRSALVRRGSRPALSRARLLSETN
jgi:hypothetical protein